MLFEEGPKFLALSGIIWGRAMPLSLLENTDWAAKVEDARKMALNERDPEIKTWLTSIVREYERLAALAEKQKKSSPPQFADSHFSSIATTSLISQSLSVTPAAIAGVTRSVL